MHLWLILLVYTGAHVMEIVYVATQSAGNELTPWSTTWQYFRVHQVSIVRRVAIVQLMFWALWSNPAVAGSLFSVAGVPGEMAPGLQGRAMPYLLAGVFGLASNKIADVGEQACAWVYRRFAKLFANGNGTPPPS